jgi:hypothetical protein
VCNKPLRVFVLFERKYIVEIELAQVSVSIWRVAYISTILVRCHHRDWRDKGLSADQSITNII